MKEEVSEELRNFVEMAAPRILHPRFPFYSVESRGRAWPLALVKQQGEICVGMADEVLGCNPKKVTPRDDEVFQAVGGS